MSFVLLWLETLIAAALFAGMMIALGARRKVYWARGVLYAAGAIVPAVPLGFFVVLCGAFYFRMHMQGVGFWAAVLLLTTFFEGYVWLLVKATRLTTTGMRRGFGWPLGRMAVGFAVCVTLLGMTYWNMALQAQVEIQALRTQAGALALSVTPPVIPDAENAALVHRQAAERYKAALTANDEKVDYRDLDPRSPEVAAYLERQNKTLELIRRAADMPRYRAEYDLFSATEEEANRMINDMGPLRAQANLLAVAAKAEAAGGKVDLALDDCRRLYAIANHAGATPMLINELVAVAVDALANKTTASVLPAVTTKEGLDRLPLLDPKGLERMFALGLRGEEAFSIARFCDIANFLEVQPTNRSAPPVSSARAGFLWMLWLREDVTNMREGMQRVRALIEEPYYKVAPQWKALEAERGRGGLLSAMLFPSYHKSVQTVSEAEALREVVTVSVAATRYRLARGGYPEKVEALVPEYLEAVPVDPFDGKALRWKKKEDGSVGIYSVGRDLVDNGGDVDSKARADAGVVLKAGG